MNDLEVQRLAHAVNNLRPSWPISSLTTFIRRNMSARNYRDASVALVFVALDCDGAGNYVTETPKRVLEAGPWWKAAEVNGTASYGMRRPPKRTEECRTHPGQYADNCAPCQTDRLAYDYAETQEAPMTTSPAPDPHDAAERVRAGLRKAVR